MKKNILFLLFFGNWLYLFAQEDSLFIFDNMQDNLFENIEEQVIDSESEEVDFADNLDFLLEGQTQKININELPAEVAYSLLKFTDYQYYQLQLYIEIYGELVTIYELAAVEGFSRSDVERIINFVEVRPAKSMRSVFRSFFRRSSQKLLLRYGQVLEKQAGYYSEQENAYLGNPLRLTFKYTFKSGDNFAMALSGEKDAGEEFFKGTQKQGFDHYAFFVQFKNIGVLKNCVIGDYNLDFGQGLVMGGRSIGTKGGGAGQIRRFASMIRPSAPMNESSNLRGVAVTIGDAHYLGTLFYSHRFFDGELLIDSDSNCFFDGSLSLSPYHRTLNEVIRKQSFYNRIYGGNFQLKRRIFSVGATITKTDFSAEILPAKELYKKFDFTGKSMCNFGMDYKVIVPKSILFGEFGVSRNGGIAFLQGGVFDVDPRCKLSVLFRYYDPKYIALNSSAFGENSLSHNEIGMYVAADFVLSRIVQLVLNGDFYYFPWLRFRTDQPTNGFDCTAKLIFSLHRNLQLHVKYQYKMKEGNYRITAYYQTLATQQQHKLRCAFNYSPIDIMKMKTEIDFVLNVLPSHSFKQGILLFQDVGVKIPKWNFGANLRFAFFDTDSYDERIYAYENDLLYMFTINGYYGKGVRFYVMLDYGYSFFDLQLRFSQTFYDDRNSISSAQELINAKHKSEIRAQVIFHI